MRNRDRETAQNLEECLKAYDTNIRELPGIYHEDNRQTLIAQIIDSIRRIKYVEILRQRRLSPLRGNAATDMFDPIKAAVALSQKGNIEEASWLVFIATHFGKSGRDGWALTKSFYNALGQGFEWDWNKAAYNPEAIMEWLEKNYGEFEHLGYRFGNHRKYESMNPAKRSFTGLVLRSYVNWILDHGSHEKLFGETLEQNDNCPRRAFNQLYRSMDSVFRFGRTGRFDYLTMIAKIGIANIEADSTYMSQATGPYAGAKLLFLGQTTIDANRKTLDLWLIELDEYLKVGMQVIEDALCNWQKSPHEYKLFKG